MDDMDECVARAIADASVERYEDAPSMYDAMGRAAIEAMRQFKMVIRQEGQVVHELRGEPDAIWKAMIDAALSKADLSE